MPVGGWILSRLRRFFRDLETVPLPTITSPLRLAYLASPIARLFLFSLFNLDYLFRYHPRHAILIPSPCTLFWFSLSDSLSSIWNALKSHLLGERSIPHISSHQNNCFDWNSLPPSHIYRTLHTTRSSGIHFLISMSIRISIYCVCSDSKEREIKLKVFW